jgi:hypothetical protein
MQHCTRDLSIAGLLELHMLFDCHLLLLGAGGVVPLCIIELHPECRHSCTAPVAGGLLHCGIAVPLTFILPSHCIG